MPVFAELVDKSVFVLWQTKAEALAFLHIGRCLGYVYEVSFVLDRKESRCDWLRVRYGVFFVCVYHLPSALFMLIYDATLDIYVSKSFAGAFFFFLVMLVLLKDGKA